MFIRPRDPSGEDCPDPAKPCKYWPKSASKLFLEDFLEGQPVSSFSAFIDERSEREIG